MTTANLPSLYEKSLEFFHKKDIQKSLEYFKMALEFVRSKRDSNKLLTLLTEMLDYSRKGADKNLEAEVLKNLGQIHAIRKDFAKGLQSYQQAMKIQKELGDEQGEAESMEYIASDFAILGKYAFAIDYYRRALDIYQELNNQEKINKIAWEIKKIEEFSEEVDRNEYLLKKFHIN